MAQSWFRSLLQGNRQPARHGKARKAGFRPRLEALEARLAPATRIWDGGGNNNNWNNRFNWAADIAPVANDDLVFPNSFQVNATLFAPVPADSKTGQINNLAAGTAFNSITYSGNGYDVTGNDVTLGAGGLQAANANATTNTFGLRLALAAVRNFNVVNPTATLALTGVIDGGGGITKLGAGFLELGGNVNNINTGPIQVNAGTLRLAKPAGLAAVNGPLTVGDGTGVDTVVLVNSNQIPNNSAVTVNSSGVLNLGNLEDTIGPLTMTGGLVTTSTTGRLTLNGNVTATSAGTASARIEGRLALGAIADRLFTVNDGPAASDLILTAAVGGRFSNPGLTKAGTGRMEMTAANPDFTGQATVNAGQLRISNAQGLGVTGSLGTTVNSGGTLEIFGNIILDEALSLSGAGALVALGGGTGFQQAQITEPVVLTGNATVRTDSNLAFADVVSGNFNLTKVGAGRLTLGTANPALGGLINVNEGSLRANNSESLGSAVFGTTVAAGAALEAGGFSPFTSAEPITLAGNGINNQGALLATGNATFTGNITLAANTTVAGIFIPDNGGNDFLGLLDLAGVISGPFNLTTSNLVTFSGPSPNTYGGNTVATGGFGNLRLNKAANVNAIPGGALTVTQGRVTIASPNQIPDMAPITLGTARLDVSAIETIGQLTLNGALSVGGAGVLTLAGDVTVNDVSPPSPFGVVTSIGNVALPATRTFTVNTGARLDFGTVSGVAGAGMVKAGAGLLRLLPATVGFSGTVTVNGGRFLRENGPLPNPVIVNNGGTLSGIRNSAYTNITVNNGGTLDSGGAGTVSFVLTDVLEANGSTVFNAGSKFHVDIRGTQVSTLSQIGQLRMLGSGTLNLGNARLEPAFLDGFQSSVGNVYTIVQNDTSNPTTGFFTDASGAVIPQGGEIVVNGVRLRINYSGGDFNDVILTHVNSASALQNRAVTPVINEGGVATFTGTIDENDPNDSFTLVVNWGDGTPEETFVFPPDSTREVRLTHRYADDPTTPDDTYTIRLRWQDDHGEGNEGELPVVVRNVAPAVSFSGSPGIVANSTYTRRGFFLDPGSDTWTVTVNYGDGTGNETLTPDANNTFGLRHRYRRPGIYRVTVTVTDDDGGVGTRVFLVTVP